MGSDLGILLVELIRGGTDNGSPGSDRLIGWLGGKGLAIEDIGGGRMPGAGPANDVRGEDSSPFWGDLLTSGLPGLTDPSSLWVLDWLPPPPPLVRVGVALLRLEFSSPPPGDDLPLLGDLGASWLPGDGEGGPLF